MAAINGVVQLVYLEMWNLDLLILVIPTVIICNSPDVRDNNIACFIYFDGTMYYGFNAYDFYGLFKYFIYFAVMHQADLLLISANQITGGFALRGSVTLTLRATCTRVATSSATISGIPTEIYLLLSGRANY